MKKFDLAIAYRIYPGISKKPLIFSDNKLALAEVALHSLKLGLSGCRAKIFAILDGCPEEYAALFYKYFARENLELIRKDRVGNFATIQLSIDLLLQQTDAEFVYFAEDDYAYQPGCFSQMIDFMRSTQDAHLITAYDHPDYYNLELHRNYATQTRQVGQQVWRTVPSTCYTFMTTRAILQKTAPLLQSIAHGNPDAGVWLAITKTGALRPDRMLKYLFLNWDFFTFHARAWIHGWRHLLTGPKYNLWAPQPSLATHLESTGIAPGFDWERVLKKQATDLGLL